MKEISKNDLNEVVLVGKGPELQTLYSIIGFNLINVGEFGLNWIALIYTMNYIQNISLF